jgi:hemerythrin-like metal-binding protein
MSFIDWPGNLATGHHVIDDEHRFLVGITNNLAEALEAGGCAENVRQVLCDLLDYATEHFSREELLMDRHRYPAADGHKLEHSALLDTISRMLLDFEKNRPISKDLMALLQHWLSDHIGRVDKALALFLLANASRPWSKPTD